MGRKDIKSFSGEKGQLMGRIDIKEFIAGKRYLVGRKDIKCGEWTLKNLVGRKVIKITGTWRFALHLDLWGLDLTGNQEADIDSQNQEVTEKKIS